MAAIRCRYCNKDLSEFTYEYRVKHEARCVTLLNPYRYSDRRCGRPTKKEKEAFLKDRLEGGASLPTI